MRQHDFLSLGGLKGIKRERNGALACCPAHEDSEPSLHITFAEDRILLKCFTGCTAKEICEALGISIKELFYDFRGNRSTSNELHDSLHRAVHTAPPNQRPGISLEEFAAAKRLPREFLAAEGVEERGGRLVFHYLLMNGQRAARQRIRLGMGTERDFIWSSEKGKPVPYGLWKLHGWQKEGYRSLILCEGESDALTCWHRELPALGIPGASNCALLQAAHINGFPELWIFQEPDQGGETFVAGLKGRLAELKYRGIAHIVKFPPETKDVSALHIKVAGAADPIVFTLEMELLWRAAETITPRFKAMKIAWAEQLEEEVLEWFWEQWIAVGNLTLFAGQGGIGKSYVSADLAARYSRGTAWPDGSPIAAPGASLIISSEDHLRAVIKPRLRRLNANQRLVALNPGEIDDVDPQTGEYRPRTMNLLADLAEFEEILDAHPQIRVVFIDPITQFLGGTPGNSNEQIRAALHPLKQIAEKRRIAIVVLTHVNKVEGTPEHKVLGSVAYYNLPRTVHLFGVLDRTARPWRCGMFPMKSNIGRLAPGWEYQISDSGVEWLSESSLSLDEAFGSGQRKEQERERG